MGFECEQPVTPYGMFWRPDGEQGRYVLTRQNVPSGRIHFLPSTVLKRKVKKIKKASPAKTDAATALPAVINASDTEGAAPPPPAIPAACHPSVSELNRQGFLGTRILDFCCGCFAKVTECDTQRRTTGALDVRK